MPVCFVNFGRFLVVTSELRFLTHARTASLWSFHQNEELVFSDDIISASKPIKQSIHSMEFPLASKIVYIGALRIPGQIQL
jgi:hypothetical protein